MLKLIELFGGIGTQTMAFEGIPKFQGHFKCVDLVEWDDKSIDVYNQVHHTDFIGGKEHGDVNFVRGSDIGSNSRIRKPDTQDLFSNLEDTTITEENNKIIHNGKDIWVMTCSSPCQSLSNAGLKDGMAPGVNEKSSFLWEGIRILKECWQLDKEHHTRQPHYFIIENVTPIHNKNNINWFKAVLDEIRSYGYNTYVMDVNGLDINQPQMRDRTFVVAALKGVQLPKYVPFKGQTFKEDPESRLAVLKALFDSTSDEDIKEEDDASTQTHKIIIYNGNTHTGIRVGSKIKSFNKDKNDRIKELKKEIAEKSKELVNFQPSLPFNGDENTEESLANEIDTLNDELEGLLNDDEITIYDGEITSLNDYPFIAAHMDEFHKNDIIDENGDIKNYAVIDYSFQSKNGKSDAEHCKVYTDKFPTLLCNTDHILLLDPAHNCLRRILAKEAWLLQTYTDEAFQDAKKIFSQHLGQKSLSSLYQSLHKTAGDAILVDAFKKVIENLPYEADPSDCAEDLDAAGKLETTSDLQASRDETWTSASDTFNKRYAPKDTKFIPKGWEDRYTPPEREDDGNDLGIYLPKDGDADPLGLYDKAFEESFKRIYHKAHLLRESK